MRTLGNPLQIFFWSYVFIYAVFCSLTITQVDLWWQLSEGEHILRTWTLPTGPAAAFGFPATPYFDEYAGYEIALTVFFKITGFFGLWLLFAGVFLAILFLPQTTSGQKYPAFDIPTSIALLMATLIMRTRMVQRPELIGVLLLVLLMVVLRGTTLDKINRRTLGWVFLIFLAWTNTHSTVLIGFFVLGLWGLSEIWLRYKSIPVAVLFRGSCLIGATALVAAALNPYGPRRLLFPFLEASDPGSTALSPEMWPVTDYSTSPGLFILMAVGLLAWGILTTRGLPPWLIVFSIFSVVISIKSARFASFLAISVLFVYAARSLQAATKAPLSFWPLVILRNFALCLLCVLLLFGDAYNFLFAYRDLTDEARLATHVRRYASDIADVPMNLGPGRTPVLCGHGIGSYLSFNGADQFRPMLDSGLSHFSDDTKRYFFFLWQEPVALDLTLDQLHVNYIITNKETFPWNPTIHRLSDWQYVICSYDGILWKRVPGGPHPLSANDRAQVSDAVQMLLHSGDVLNAFDFSTLLDKPADSLAILEKYSGTAWTDVFFNSLCAWVDSLPAGDAQAFLTGDHPRPYPLLDAILSARIGPDTYDKFIATHPAGPQPWFWKAVAVRVLLQKGDRDQARIVFDSISPVPVSSTAYYELWQQVHAGDEHDAGPGAYGRWQTWDDDSRKFLGEMSEKLNSRLADLQQANAR